MHESDLTEDLLAHTLRHAREARACRVLCIHLRLGALSDATPESIQFYFDSLASGTLAEGAQLEFKTASGEAHCPACGGDVTIDDILSPCPLCGAFPLVITGGNAVYLDHLDVETN